MLYISFKSWILGGFSFFNFQLFSLTKILTEGNLFAKKVPSPANSALSDTQVLVCQQQCMLNGKTNFESSDSNMPSCEFYINFRPFLQQFQSNQKIHFEQGFNWRTDLIQELW